jgi:hypothetical protein
MLRNTPNSDELHLYLSISMHVNHKCGQDRKISFGGSETDEQVDDTVSRNVHHDLRRGPLRGESCPKLPHPSVGLCLKDVGEMIVLRRCESD